MDEATWVPPTADEAIGLWGMGRLNKLAEQWGEAWRVTDPSSVTVSFDFDEGYACCGGRDESCYCSMASPATAEVRINSWQARTSTTIPATEFDFTEVIREVISAAGGLVSA